MCPASGELKEPSPLPKLDIGEAIHDLNNVLQIFSSNLDMIAGKPEVARQTQRMNTASQKLKEVIGKLTLLKNTI